MQVPEIAERARKILIDEPERAAYAFEPDLHVNAGRIFDVVARGLHQPRDLAQLREHPACALGERRVVEQRLPGEARREDVGVLLRASLPAPDLLELEETRPDACVQRRTLQAL